VSPGFSSFVIGVSPEKAAPASEVQSPEFTPASETLYVAIAVAAGAVLLVFLLVANRSKTYLRKKYGYRSIR
jgi:hypothetical protein